MGKIPGGNRPLAVEKQDSGVLGGMEEINIYDQEQCNKERGRRIQPWVVSYLGVWRRKEATEGDGSKQPPRVSHTHTYTHTHTHTHTHTPGARLSCGLQCY